MKKAKKPTPSELRPTPEDHEAILIALLSNMQTAAADLRNYLRIRRYHRQIHNAFCPKAKS